MFGNEFKVASGLASIHLTAIRFCLLVIAKITQQASGIADIRHRISVNIQQISFGAPLWSVFRAIIAGGPGGFENPAGGYRHAHHGDDSMTRSVLFCANPAT